MKAETVKLLENFHSSKRFNFIDSDKGLEMEHDLTDQEKQNLVETEYGKTIVGSVDDLFVKIMRNVIRLAVKQAKHELKDRLSDL